MWPLLNLHLRLSSSLSRSLLPCFQILNILSLLLPSFTSALKIETLNNGTNSSAGEKDVRSYLPGNATETDIVTAGELTRTIMGLLPSLLQNQTAAEKAELNKRVNEKVETFFSQLRLGGGEGGLALEKEKKEESSKAVKDECASRPCNPKAICVAIGQSDYRCTCPGDLAPLVRRGRQAPYITSYKGPVCGKKKAADIGNKKSYKGTLKGGLKLVDDSREKKLPVVAVVDDIAKATDVNVEKMKGEHFKDPTHFGIHISQLETLSSDKVKENGPVDKSIIADMFD